MSFESVEECLAHLEAELRDSLPKGHFDVLEYASIYYKHKAAQGEDPMKEDALEQFTLEIKQAIAKMDIYKYKKAIYAGLRTQQVLVITAELTSGKYVQIPQYFWHHPMSKEENIICIYNERNTAEETAKKLNDFMGKEAAKTEYSRLESQYLVCISEREFLEVLLSQKNDEVPIKYANILIICEAEKRTVECDLILGLMKDFVLPKRTNFRMILIGDYLDITNIKQ